MKFEINRNLLEQTVLNVSKGLSSKTPMPILTAILIQATNDKLIFTTTNKEISIQIVLSADDKLNIIETGSCAVPGKYFVDIVKNIEGETVEFTVFDESTIKIISDKSDFTLISFEKNNFPKIEMETATIPLCIPCKEFKKIVRQTNFACSTTENRIILTSANFKFENSLLTVIATDSYRLAKKVVPVETELLKAQMNVPSKSLDEFVKVIPDSNDLVEIFVDSNRAIFKHKNLAFATRLVEGVYPDTKSLFPITFLMDIKFDKAALCAAVDRASLLLESDSNGTVKFIFKENSEVVEIVSNSSEIGRVVETLEILNRTENIDFQIAFSSKTLSEALKSFDSKVVELHVVGEIKPAIITAENSTELTQLLLPVRIF